MSRYLFFILVLFTFKTFAGSLPNQVSLEYEIKKGEMSIANVKETVTHNGQTYVLRSEAKAVGPIAIFNKGAIKRQSEGEITDKGLRPIEFRDQRGDKSPNVAQFDWTKKTLYLKFDGKTEHAALSEGTLDRLSFPYNFAFVSSKDKEIKFAMTDGKRVQNYQYNLIGKEILKTPLGDIETLHFAKQRQNDENGSDVWLATQHHFLPVRILITEKDGKNLDQTITKITY